MRVPAFVVIGGGENGVYIVRQLARAVAAGRLATDRILVVDRDAACAVASHTGAGVVLEVADWDDWLDRHLAGLDARAHVVPYHWAPHLFLNWLARQANRAGAVATRGDTPAALPGVPFARPSRDGDLALSYATWTCPPTCIEPALCPHTRGEKSWSLCADLQGGGTAEALVFECLHLVFGVGTVPVAALLDAKERVLSGLASGPRQYRVATSSHCHALAATLDVRPSA
ncbi:MAG TPA: hypothetical protein VMV21_12390 [Vicinamibacteria bacterium]|nr:hypothetical protein [Vicinamibacteria bacterium]